MELLGIAFIVLKLTNQIDWSWFWILSPFWIPLAFLLSTFGLAIGLAILNELAFDQKTK